MKTGFIELMSEAIEAFISWLPSSAYRSKGSTRTRRKYKGLPVTFFHLYITALKGHKTQRNESNQIPQKKNGQRRDLCVGILTDYIQAAPEKRRDKRIQILCIQFQKHLLSIKICCIARGGKSLLTAGTSGSYLIHFVSNPVSPYRIPPSARDGTLFSEVTPLPPRGRASPVTPERFIGYVAPEKCPPASCTLSDCQRFFHNKPSLSAQY